jgi:hypothetical protein
MLASPQPGVPAPKIPVDLTPTPVIRQASAQEISPNVLGELVTGARKTYQKINDYSCILVKQERVGGKLLPEQTALMTARTQPFSVWMKFSAPLNISGQEVCYVAGKNNGKMRVKPAGLKGAFGYVTIPVDDARALAQNRHTVDSAGLGAMIEQIATAQALCRDSKSTTTFAEYQFNGKMCHRIEITHQEGKAYCHRCVIFFDKELCLPVRFEAYDRPTATNPSGELIESYSYANLKLNPGVPESVFNK